MLKYTRSYTGLNVRGHHRPVHGLNVRGHTVTAQLEVAIKEIGAAELLDTGRMRQQRGRLARLAVRMQPKAHRSEGNFLLLKTVFAFRGFFASRSAQFFQFAFDASRIGRIQRMLGYATCGRSGDPVGVRSVSRNTR